MPRRQRCGLWSNLGSVQGKSGPLESNWVWGLSLIAVTIAVHATGIAAIAVAMLSFRSRVETQGRLRLGHQLMILVVLITMVGLLLAILHGIEAGLWGSHRPSAAAPVEQPDQ